MAYYFGVYHWRKQVHSIALLGIALLLAGVAYPLSSARERAVGIAALAVGAHGASGARKLLRPRPWAVSQQKYDTLAKHLPLDEADRVLDVGCGTGRSLVGLSPHVSGASVTALDRFDDSVILGNVPRLARRNAAAADLGVALLAGDGTTLPLRDGSFDVVTVNMVLHDLPEVEARRILAELRRVCKPGGTVGLLELPLIDDEQFVPAEFWQELLNDTGFDIEAVDSLPWKDDHEYVVLIATPSEGAAAQPSRTGANDRTVPEGAER